MLKYFVLIMNCKDFILKKVLFVAVLIFSMVGCRSSSNANSGKVLNNEKVVLLVHGLNSGSSTWEDMTTKISKVLGVIDGSSVEIGLSIAIKEGMKCWDASDDALISCSRLSSIKGENFFRKEKSKKVEVSDRIFGLDRGQFTLNRINWKLQNDGSDGVVSQDDKKRSRFSKQRLFSINFSNSNQLTYDAQGFQLAKTIENIKKITGVKNIILIGHSMGGLASRAYIQNEQSSGVQKLITIDTPHLGGKTFSKVGAGFYLGGKNASVNLAHDSKALRELNDIDNVAGKYDGIEVYHLGYSDGLDGLDILHRGRYYDESDGIVDIASQMGLDTLAPHRVIFSPIIKGDIREYKNLLTGEMKRADEVIKSENDYGVSERSVDFSIAHTEVLSDDAYLKYILEIIKKD
jgi:pimeloyl-ACP methyl ester carboxylesterase